VAQWLECSPRKWEVVGLIPDPVITDVDSFILNDIPVLQIDYLGICSIRESPTNVVVLTTLTHLKSIHNQ